MKAVSTETCPDCGAPILPCAGCEAGTCEGADCYSTGKTCSFTEDPEPHVFYAAGCRDWNQKMRDPEERKETSDVQGS